MAKCNNSSCINPGLLQCFRCKHSVYCSKTCQTNDWKNHKKNCIPYLDKDSLRGTKIKIGGITYNKKLGQDTVHSKANECIEKRDSKGALELLNRCSEVYDKIDIKDVSKIRVSKALALILEGRADKAERELRKAIQLDGNNATAYNALGMLYDEVGKYNLAKRLLERAMEIQPKQPEYQVNYALVLRKLGNIEDAEKVLCDVVKDNVEFSKRLGIIS